MSPPVVPAPAACVVSPAQSTWYYRLDSFSWNERVGGVDVVNEYGPLSTLGYVRRSGVERFRIELFGGTMAYDGSDMSHQTAIRPITSRSAPTTSAAAASTNC